MQDNERHAMPEHVKAASTDAAANSEAATVLTADGAHVPIA